MHGQLADVVEQGRPPQPVTVGEGEVELVGDHVREGPDPFGVTTRFAVVTAKRGRQGKDLLGDRRGDRGAGAVAGHVRPGPALEVPGQARPPGHLQALGGPVGEEHGHLQQCGQGEKAPAQPVGAEEGEHRRGQHGLPPEPLVDQAMPVGDDAPRRHRGGNRQGEGHGDGGDGQHRAEHRVGTPPVRPGHLARPRYGRCSGEPRGLTAHLTWVPSCPPGLGYSVNGRSGPELEGRSRTGRATGCRHGGLEDGQWSQLGFKE